MHTIISKTIDDNIRGFPGYHITKEGKLYRYGKLLKVYHHHRYLRCKLHNGSISKNVKIHRLVAEAYIPNPNNLPIVMHLDDNPLNNIVSNLKWGTHKENRYLAIVNCKLPRLIGKNNPCYGLRGSKNPNAKLKHEDRVKIKELHVKGISAREIRNKYFPNVCEETIRRTINQGLI